MDTGNDQGWQLEEDAFAEGLDDDVYAMVECVELPAELCAHAEVATGDPLHAANFEDWLGFLSQNSVMLAVEQSCDEGACCCPGTGVPFA